MSVRETSGLGARTQTKPPFDAMREGGIVCKMFHPQKAFSAYFRGTESSFGAPFLPFASPSKTFIPASPRQAETPRAARVGCYKPLPARRLAIHLDVPLRP